MTTNTEALTRLASAVQAFRNWPGLEHAKKLRESREYSELVLAWEGAAAALASARNEPMFWVRLRSDGCYEGPIHDSVIEDVRKQSGAWTPLYAGQAAPSEQDPDTWSQYVAGVVVAYLGGGVDDERIKPIAGIIQRRLVRLRPAPSEQRPATDIDEAQIQRMTEQGAKAWSGVDAQALRDGGEQRKPQPFNEWWMSLPEGRRNALLDEKWALAEAAYSAGIRSTGGGQNG